MVSKGVDYYSFIATDGTSIAFSGPKVGSTTTASNNFAKNHLEIDSSNLPWATFTGTFEWNVLRDGTQLYSRQQEIGSLTGHLGDGNLSPLMNTPAVVGTDYTISYGLYDAGSGVAGLPKADQAWVSIVPDLTKWMSQVAPPNSAQEQMAFAQFVLAAAHDAGMNTMDGINLVTNGAYLHVLIAALSILVDVPGLGALLQSAPEKIMLGLAITQKETTTSMLNMGVRYFDFRPAYLLPQVRSLVPSSSDTLYHTHLVIPGQRYDHFLAEIVAFLRDHPTEIVVIRTCSDGIKECVIPDAQTITQYAQNAVAGSGISLGDSSCFQTSVASLRASNKRLILVQNNAKYDSYSDGPYETLSPSTIISQFESMNTGGQAGKDFTVLQCQGTATGITDVIVYAVAAANWSTSPLMATKASFDIQTLPWILSNALNNLQAEQNIVIMNDFIDGATTYTAYQLSRQRFAPESKSDDVRSLVKGLPAALEARPSSVQSGDISEGEAESAKAKADAALAHQQVLEAQLRTTVASQQSVLNAQSTVTEKDKSIQAVLEAAHREAEDVTQKQAQLVALAEKRLQAAKAGTR